MRKWICTGMESMDNHDGRVLIALIYGGWIHRLELDGGDNLSIFHWQMVIDLGLAR